MKTVLYFQSQSKSSSAAEKLVGVREIANKANWHLQVIAGATTPAKIRQLVTFWKPAGIIVECGERTENLSGSALLLDVPVVFIDKNPDTLPNGAFCIHHDSVTAGLEAAKELMTVGIENFAFIPFPGSWRWNDERRDGFLAALELNNYSCSIFKSDSAEIDSPVYSQDLNLFLKQLPKPCAIFAAHDHLAEKVITECRHLSIKIPEQITVLGVDDYKPICEHTKPRLSSVKPDFRHAGNLAAMMLIAIMRDGQNFNGEHFRKYGTNKIIHRESTRIPRMSADPQVDAALQLIRNEACNGLTAETVLQTFSCSRTSAAAKFRRDTGHSILETIHATQLKRVKEMLLHHNLQLKSISDFCGFKSANSLRKFFLRKTGMTMSDWRRLNLNL